MATQTRWKIPLVDLGKQYLAIKDEIDEAIARVHRSGSYVMGDEVIAFEMAWAAACEMKHCIAVSSGTDALYLALEAVKPREGSVAVLPAFNFIAAAEAATRAGYGIRFVDVDPQTGNMPMPLRAQGERDVLVPVSMFGRMLDWNPPQPRNRDAVWVEDMAQAHGILPRATASAFSFYPTKNLGAMGQAGAVVTNSDNVASDIRQLRAHGEAERFVHPVLSGNYRMDEIQAAVLNVKLPYLSGWTERRRKLAAIYNSELAGLRDDGELDTPGLPERHVFHIYNITTLKRDELRTFLAEHGVETAVRYPLALHQQPVEALRLAPSGGFPNAERFASQCLSLPLHDQMEFDEVKYVCGLIHGFFHG